MNKPSDAVDFMDKVLDIHDYMIDAQNRRCQMEIKWLNDNYNNSEALRGYFLSMYDVGNMALKYQYFYQLRGYTLEKLQEMATFRASLLSGQYYANELKKGDHSALKPISEILKLMEQ